MLPFQRPLKPLRAALICVPIVETYFFWTYLFRRIFSDKEVNLYQCYAVGTSWHLEPGNNSSHWQELLETILTMIYTYDKYKSL